MEALGRPRAALHGAVGRGPGAAPHLPAAGLDEESQPSFSLMMICRQLQPLGTNEDDERGLVVALTTGWIYQPGFRAYKYDAFQIMPRICRLRFFFG
eukprot:scaffold279427_cov24-Prasinocladus_malaysianus.AAC.1